MQLIEWISEEIIDLELESHKIWEWFSCARVPPLPPLHSLSLLQSSCRLVQIDGGENTLLGVRTLIAVQFLSEGLEELKSFGSHSKENTATSGFGMLKHSLFYMYLITQTRIHTEPKTTQQHKIYINKHHPASTNTTYAHNLPQICNPHNKISMVIMVHNIHDLHQQNNNTMHYTHCSMLPP